MTVIDDDVLAEFRTLGRCELCGRRGYPMDPHHAFIKRGIGGGSRLDLRENLIALDRMCHTKAEQSKEFNRECQEVIAKRHGATVEEIHDWLTAVNWTLKERPMPARTWKDAAA